MPYNLLRCPAPAPVAPFLCRRPPGPRPVQTLLAGRGPRKSGLAFPRAASQDLCCLRIYQDMGGSLRGPRPGVALDRFVTVWSCLLAPPLTLAALVLTLFGVLPWYVAAALFATVVLPPVVVSPPPVADGDEESLDETLRGHAHDVAMRDDRASTPVEPPG